MNLVGEIRRRARHIVGPIVGITLFAYFAYHAVQGDRGLIAWLKLGQQVEAVEVQYDKVLAERREFARRVSLLQPQGLDPDLLEERARTELGLADPDDIIILSHAEPPPLREADGPPKLALDPPAPAERLDRRALDDLIGDTLGR